jgi:hypothetical protein
LIIIQGHGRGGAFIQTDYLAQVLEPAIEVILEDFGLVTAELGYAPLLWKMETLHMAINLLQIPVLYIERNMVSSSLITLLQVLILIQSKSVEELSTATMCQRQQ